MEISQNLCGVSSVVDHYKANRLMSGERYFYLLDRTTGQAFCPSSYPYYNRLDRFSCEHMLNCTVVNSEKYNVRFTAKAYVPAAQAGEVWELRVKNLSSTHKEFSLFAAFPFSEVSPMGGECKNTGNITYRYSYPYHVRYEEKREVENQPAYAYIYYDIRPDSFDTSISGFFGCEDINVLPLAVKNGTCSNMPTETDGFLAASEHRLSLEPDSSATVRIFISQGTSIHDIERLTKSIDFNRLWQETEEKKLSAQQSLFISTPDKRLDNMINYWIKRQVTMLTRLNRMDTYCPCRNQLQDALGYSVIDPQEALRFALNVLRRQQHNGFLKQWYMTDGSPDKKLCLVNHCDAPIWLIICMIEIINATCDLTVYDRKEPYIDNGSDTIYQHLLNAANYLWSSRGNHGLCLMLDGDWTDPINGAGRLEKGESVWASEAFSYAAGRLAEIAASKGDTKNAAKLLEMKDTLNDSINTYGFDGDHYICGYSDDGIAFGTVGDKSGTVFLNTQTWAIICGAAQGTRLDAARRAIKSLDTNFGCLLLAPPFDCWDDIWGRLSIKQPGTTENGSVYCHGTMFKAYADTVVKDGNAAYSSLIKTLPFDKRAKQFPTFVPNYYFGLSESPNFGVSSGNINTGTAAWFMWVVVRHILGIQPSGDGNKINPCLPDGFENVSVSIDGKRYLIAKKR